MSNDIEDRAKAKKIVDIVRIIGYGCSAKLAEQLRNEFFELISASDGIPDPTNNAWRSTVFACFCANMREMGEAIARQLIEKKLHSDDLLLAIELMDRGENIKAAYVARGCREYNNIYSETSVAAIPHAVLSELAELPVSAQVLDLGCGTGLIGVACRQAGYEGRLVGVDLVEEMVAAIPPGLYSECIAADAIEWLESSSQKWDFILSFGVFVHFDNAYIENILSLIGVRLKKGGVLAFNASENQEPFIHPLGITEAGALIEAAGLELEGIIRGDARTTYTARRPK